MGRLKRWVIILAVVFNIVIFLQVTISVIGTVRRQWFFNSEGQFSNTSNEDNATTKNNITNSTVNNKTKNNTNKIDNNEAQSTTEKNMTNKNIPNNNLEDNETKRDTKKIMRLMFIIVQIM